METRTARGPSTDPSRSIVTPGTIFRYKQHPPLNTVFAPKSIAVIGEANGQLLCESICDDETAYATIVIRAEGGVV
jgi:hypothetical protein